MKENCINMCHCQHIAVCDELVLTQENTLCTVIKKKKYRYCKIKLQKKIEIEKYSSWPTTGAQELTSRENSIQCKMHIHLDTGNFVICTLQIYNHVLANNVHVMIYLVRQNSVYEQLYFSFGVLPTRDC